MGSSQYIQRLRNKVGNSTLMIPGVAAAILDATNRILLQEKATESWSLPAGMIESGESPSEAVVREVEEETGLIVTPKRILGVFGGRQFRYVYPNGDKVEYTIILMHCSIVHDTGVIEDLETKSLRYFDKQSMPELALPYPKGVLFNELSNTYIH